MKHGNNATDLYSISQEYNLTYRPGARIIKSHQIKATKSANTTKYTKIKFAYQCRIKDL